MIGKSRAPLLSPPPPFMEKFFGFCYYSAVLCLSSFCLIVIGFMHACDLKGSEYIKRIVLFSIPTAIHPHFTCKKLFILIFELELITWLDTRRICSRMCVCMYLNSAVLHHLYVLCLAFVPLILVQNRFGSLAF